MKPKYRRRPGPPGDDCLRDPNRPARWKNRPSGWRNESHRHSLAARGIQTKASKQKKFWKSLEMDEPTEEKYLDDPYKYLAEHDQMQEELYEVGGYYDPEHWYMGNGPELIIVSERMWKDPRARKILRKYGVNI